MYKAGRQVILSRGTIKYQFLGIGQIRKTRHFAGVEAHRGVCGLMYRSIPKSEITSLIGDGSAEFILIVGNGVRVGTREAEIVPMIDDNPPPSQQLADAQLGRGFRDSGTCPPPHTCASGRLRPRCPQG
jgi:hypothetical protein